MTPHRRFVAVTLALAASSLIVSPIRGQCIAVPDVVGRWDLTVRAPGGDYPSWLEVTRSGECTLVGRFVGRTGSARPISRVELVDATLRFAIPPQWEPGEDDLRLEARFEGDHLVGIVTTPDGQQHSFTADRAPPLLHARPTAWEPPIDLFNGRDLDGWTSWPRGSESHWVVRDGILTNTASGANLVTTRTFDDFILHVEFRYPAGGNSGIYLRGRHEVQIEDPPRREWPEVIDLGGIYGFLAPNEAIEAKPGEWHSFEITLIGRRVTVILDGRTVISDRIIPGITGGALDSNEGQPGPILLQGDHTGVEFRNVRLTPAARQ